MDRPIIYMFVYISSQCYLSNNFIFSYYMNIIMLINTLIHAYMHTNIHTYTGTYTHIAVSTASLYHYAICLSATSYIANISIYKCDYSRQRSSQDTLLERIFHCNNINKISFIRRLF